MLTDFALAETVCIAFICFYVVHGQQILSPFPGKLAIFFFFFTKKNYKHFEQK